eukprot:12831616-Alexandrium_andersonii.AAC.1
MLPALGSACPRLSLMARCRPWFRKPVSTSGRPTGSDTLPTPSGARRFRFLRLILQAFGRLGRGPCAANPGTPSFLPSNVGSRVA